MELGRILVTGANGQLGLALARRVAGDASLGARLRAVVRSERAARTLRDALGEACPSTRILDYTDTETLALAAQDCRAAVHLVGILLESRQSRYADAHEKATRSLVKAAGQAGLERIVYLSILGVEPGSRNACLASKHAAERILLESKTPAVVLRVPMVLGPGDRSSGILRAQARAALLPMFGGGRAPAQPIFAGDVVEAILAALSRPELDGSVLELAGPESLPARELVARVGALHGTRPRVLPVPVLAAKAAAWAAERLLTSPPLTPAMLEVITRGDSIDPEPARARLGIRLTPLDETLRRCCAPGDES